MAHVHAPLPESGVMGDAPYKSFPLRYSDWKTGLAYEGYKNAHFTTTEAYNEAVIRYSKPVPQTFSRRSFHVRKHTFDIPDIDELLRDEFLYDLPASDWVSNIGCTISQKRRARELPRTDGHLEYWVQDVMSHLQRGCLDVVQGVLATQLLSRGGIDHEDHKIRLILSLGFTRDSGGSSRGMASDCSFTANKLSYLYAEASALTRSVYRKLSDPLPSLLGTLQGKQNSNQAEFSDLIKQREGKPGQVRDVITISKFETKPVPWTRAVRGLDFLVSKATRPLSPGIPSSWNILNQFGSEEKTAVERLIYQIVEYSGDNLNLSHTVLAANVYGFAYICDAVKSDEPSDYFFMTENFLDPEFSLNRDVERHEAMIDIIIWHLFVSLWRVAPSLFVPGTPLQVALARQIRPSPPVAPKGFGEVMNRATGFTIDFLARHWITAILSHTATLRRGVHSFWTPQGYLHLQGWRRWGRWGVRVPPFMYDEVQERERSLLLISKSGGFVLKIVTGDVDISKEIWAYQRLSGVANVPELLAPLLDDDGKVCGIGLRHAGTRLLPNLLEVFREKISTAVRALHEAGVHHHDLHIENILVDVLGRIMIVDFESAVRAEDCEGSDDLDGCPDKNWMISTTIRAPSPPTSSTFSQSLAALSSIIVVLIFTLCYVYLESCILNSLYPM
ncbi:hypothetical protein BKA70DRAFT_1235286 [Coprinopsis sp. MPI-PUGE-AT-0042]|nr:hypothetical protein BKA70DRAFT_1235286 [Coprinopsis sp. MPI-PUGE-AT-0042]